MKRSEYIAQFGDNSFHMKIQDRVFYYCVGLSAKIPLLKAENFNRIQYSALENVNSYAKEYDCVPSDEMIAAMCNDTYAAVHQLEQETVCLNYLASAGKGTLTRILNDWFDAEIDKRKQELEAEYDGIGSVKFYQTATAYEEELEGQKQTILDLIGNF